MPSRAREEQRGLPLPRAATFGQVNFCCPCSALFSRTYAIQAARDSAKTAPARYLPRARGRGNESGNHNGARMAAETDIAYASAATLLDLYRGKALSPVEATRLILDRLDALQPQINAFCIVDRDGAMAAAARSEARWLRGEPAGPLDGVPVTIKDLILMRGFRTLRGSRLVERDQDWSEDAPATARLRGAGAVIIGKTTTPEFGWKALGDSPLTG